MFGELIVPGRLTGRSWHALRPLAEATAVRVGAQRSAGCEFQRAIGCLFVNPWTTGMVHFFRGGMMGGVFDRHVRSHLVPGAHVPGVHDEHRCQRHLGPYQDRDEQNRGRGLLRHRLYSVTGQTIVK